MRPSRRFDRWIHGKVIYPAVVRALGERELFPRLEELRRLERLDPRELLRYQAERLADTLNYAGARSPHYAETWGGLRRVEAAEAHAVLRSLPLVSKEELQQRPERLIARGHVGRLSRKITGGSTGQPVTVVKDRHATARERAAMWLGYGWRGVGIGDRAARFWGAPLAAGRRWLTRLSDLAMNRTRFSAFAFDEADLARYWRECVSFQPDYFHGYVSMLEAFARFVTERGYDGGRLRLKSIVATSEVLTPPQRRLIESAFAAPVQIEYGCGEVGPIAYECERGSLHLLAPDLVVELLQPDGTAVEPGEAGEIVLTDLNNRAMPLVRYRVGDFGTMGAPCGCGRAFPTLAAIWGRAYDFVEAPDGRRYHGEFFMYAFEDLRRAGVPVQAFQVTQEGPRALDVAVVIREDLGAEREAAIRRALSGRLRGMDLRVRRVERIDRAPSGKMQVIRNLWLRRELDRRVSA